MADQDQGEKTEEPTARKLQKAREDGQVAKSIEIPAVIVLLFVVLTLRALSNYSYGNLANLLTTSFIIDETPDATSLFFINIFYKYSLIFFKILLPILLVAFVLALLSNFLQVGFYVSWKAIVPKFDKLDPIKGFQQKFSIRALVDLVKSVTKLSIIGSIAYFSVASEIKNFKTLYQKNIASIFVYILSTAFWIVVKVLLVMLVVALLDYLFQRWKFMQEMMMTKQEMKIEYKQSEGDPQVRAKIRQAQLQIAKKRMIQDVPKASFVLTNPTHLAIAIKYEPMVDIVPMVLAKGAGAIAERIKKVADEAKVPIIENKELARTLYKVIDVGEPIPVEFYGAVAEIMAYIYRLNRQQPS